MNLYDIVSPMTVDEAKATSQRLDAKCWHNKKIGKPATKVKNGVRVNNCVPKESSNDPTAVDSTSPVGGKVDEDAFAGAGNSWSSEQDQWAHESADPVVALTGVDEDEGDAEGLPHLTKELLTHIVQQVGTEGAHAIIKSLEWGDGAAEELLALILKDLKHDISDEEIAEHIVKVKGGYELKSKHGNKNLGKYPTRAGAEKRERQVQYFKHAGESIEEAVNPALANLTPDEIKGIGMMIQDWHDIPTIIRIFDNKPTAQQITAIATANMQQGVAEMDKSQKGAAGWNIDDYDYSKGKWTRGKIMTAKDAVKSTTKDLDAAFNQADKKKPKPVKESYWTKLQHERSTKLNTLINELSESIKDIK